MKNSLFLSAILGGALVAPASAATYSWTTVDSTITPAKDATAITYTKTISMDGTTTETVSGDIKVVSTGDTALDSTLSAADSIYISEGRMLVTSSSDLGSGAIFIKGGQLWYKGSALSNDLYIGTSTYGGGENGDKAALRLQSNCTLSGTITLGEDARINVTSGATAAISGNISGADKTLSLTAFYNASTINLSGTNTIGTLALAETEVGAWEKNLTVNINGATTATDVTIGAATAATLNIGDSGSLTADLITIGAKGTFNRNAGTAGTLDLSNVTAVSGGTLALSNLSTGAAGTIVQVKSDFAGTISVTSGQLNANSTTKQLGNATISMNGGSLTFTNGQTEDSNVLSNDIELLANSTNIQVWGSTFNAKITGSISGAGKTLTKSDDGTVALAGTTTLGTLTVNAGKIRFLGTTEKTIGAMSGSVIVGGDFGVTSSDTQTIQLTWDENGNSGTIKSGTFSVSDMDMSNGNSASGSVTLASGVKMTVTDDSIWYSTKGASVIVKSGAELVNSNFSIKGRGEDGAVFGTYGTPTAQGKVSSIMGSNAMAVTSADITYSGTDDTTISTHVSGSTLSTTTESGKVTIATAAELVSVDAKSDIAIDADTSVSGSASFAKALTVENSATLTLMAASTSISDLTLNKGTIILGSSTTEAGHDYTLTTSTLNVNDNSTIYANLVMNGTTTFASNKSLTMGCTVEITENAKIVMDASQLAGLDTAASDKGFALITGVTGYTAANQVFVYDSATATTPSTHYLWYDSASKTVWVTPEPATATLSLLALAGLAARRRRK